MVGLRHGFFVGFIQHAPYLSGKGVQMKDRLITNLSHICIKGYRCAFCKRGGKRLFAAARVQRQRKEAQKTMDKVKIRSDDAENAPYTSQPSSLFVADGRKMLLICRKDVTNLSQRCY